MTPPRVIPIDDKDESETRPPRSETAKDKDTTPPQRKGRTTKADRIRNQLAQTYTMLGMAAMPFDIIYGQYVSDRADDMADSWMELAETNPRVMAALTKFTEGGAVGGVVVAHISLAAPLLARRGIIPAPVGVMAMSQSQWVDDNGGPALANAYVNGTIPTPGTPPSE